jgi:hypothetical protein
MARLSRTLINLFLPDGRRCRAGAFCITKKGTPKAVEVPVCDKGIELDKNGAGDGNRKRRPSMPAQDQISAFMSIFRMPFTGTCIANTAIIGMAAASRIGAIDALPSGTIRIRFTAS